VARLPVRRDLEGDGRTFDISRIREQKLVVLRVNLVLEWETKYYWTYKENGTMVVRVKIIDKVSNFPIGSLTSARPSA